MARVNRSLAVCNIALCGSVLDVIRPPGIRGDACRGRYIARRSYFFKVVVQFPWGFCQEVEKGRFNLVAACSVGTKSSQHTTGMIRFRDPTLREYCGDRCPSGRTSGVKRGLRGNTPSGVCSQRTTDRPPPQRPRWPRLSLVPLFSLTPDDASVLAPSPLLGGGTALHGPTAGDASRSTAWTSPRWACTT